MVKIGRPRAPGLLAVIAAPLAWTPLSAETVSGAMAVSLIVEQSCHLDLRPLRFETLQGVAQGGDADSSLAVACTPETAFVVSMDDGQHRAEGGRRMASANGGFLAYELYSDAARTRRWGASLAESVPGQIVSASAVTLPVYGRIEGVAGSPGAYSDVVTVTVSF